MSSWESNIIIPRIKIYTISLFEILNEDLEFLKKYSRMRIFLFKRYLVIFDANIQFVYLKFVVNVFKSITIIGPKTYRKMFIDIGMDRDNIVMICRLNGLDI